MVDELKPLIRHTDRKPQPPKDRRAMIALGHAALTLAELVSAVQTARRQAPPPARPEAPHLRPRGDSSRPGPRPGVTPTTYEHLEAMLLADYKANERKSLERVEVACGHLRAFFGSQKAQDITADRATAYVVWRQDERATNATINRELAALKRMFRLGEIAGKVDRRPHIQMLQERNARTGFFEPAQFQACSATCRRHSRSSSRWPTSRAGGSRMSF
jgi:hypothetical protein